MREQVISELERTGVPFTVNAPMHTYTTWKIGGRCDLIVFPRTIEEISAAVRILNAEAVPWMVIGKGSNMLVSDEGFRGAVLRLAGEWDTASFNEDGVLAGGGFSLITLSLQAAKHGFAGLDFCRRDSRYGRRSCLYERRSPWFGRIADSIESIRYG